MSEAMIQHDIVTMLRHKGIMVHSVPNEGAGSGIDAKIRTGNLIATGLLPGVGDLVVWWPCPDGVKIGYIEVKTPKGIQSQWQKEFQSRCEKAGVPYLLARSVDDVVAILEAQA